MSDEETTRLPLSPAGKKYLSVYLRKIGQLKEEPRSYALVAVLLVVLVGAFYWFQIRPASIKSECASGITYWSSVTTARYNGCLHAHGL